MLNKSLKLIAAFLAAGIIYAGTAYVNPSYAYADDTTSVVTEEVSAPHFDTNGVVVVNDIKYHKTGDRTVEVYKGMDMEEEVINIPSIISVDGVTYDVISIGASAFYNIPETKTVVDEDGNVTQATDEMVPFKAKKIVIPQNIKAIGNDCFYGLVNVQSIDLSNVESIGSTSLNMDSKAVLDRVKLGNDFDPYYTDVTNLWAESTGWRMSKFRTLKFKNYDFNRIQFRKIDNSIASRWLVKSNVRINELQDPEVKSGYNFSGWKQNSYVSNDYEYFDVNYTSTAGVLYSARKTYNLDETYTYYTPSYELGQTLTDMEDKIKEVMSTMVVTVNTTESDILKMVEKCKTSDNIAYTIDDFRVVNPDPENEVKGAVRCTINLTNKNDDTTKAVNFDIAITEAPVLPSETELKGYIDSYREYTTTTTSDELVNYVKEFVTDKRLTVKINNFTNDAYHVHGNLIITNTVDGTTKKIYISKAVYSNISAVVKYSIDNLIVDASSNEQFIINQIKNVIADDRYSVKVCDFKNSNGCVMGTVVTSDKYGVICINDLNVTSNFSAIVDEKAVNEALNNMSVGAATVSNDVINALRPVVNTDLFTIIIDNFCNENGNVSGTAVITKVDGTVSKFPFAKTYTNTITNPSGSTNSGNQSGSTITGTGNATNPGTSSGTVNGGTTVIPSGNTGAGAGITVGNTTVSSPVNVIVLGGSGSNGTGAANTNVTYEDLLKLLLQMTANNGQTTVVSA